MGASFMKKYVYANKKYIFLDILFSALYNVCVATIPLIVKTLMDLAGIGQLRMDNLSKLVIFYLIVALSMMLLQYLRQFFSWKYSARFERMQRDDLMSQIMNSNYQDFSKFTKEEYLSIFSNDIQAIEEQYLMRIVDIFNSGIALIVYACFMFYYLGIMISLVIIFMSLLALLIPKITGKELGQRRATHLSAVGKMTSVAADVLSGFMLTNSRTKDHVLHYFEKSSKDVEEKEVKYGVFRAFTIVLSGTATYLLNIMVFAVAGFMFITKKITLGTISASIGYIDNFLWPVSYIVTDINDLIAIKKVIQKVESILDRKIENKANIENPQQLSFNHVSVDLADFKLNDIHFKVHKGKKVAFIGHSGSGKSTIFNLITQRLSVDEGTITIDETLLNQLDTAHIVDGVFLGNHIYATSFVDNITMFGTYSLDRLNHYLTLHPNDKINELMKVSNCESLSNGEKQMTSLLRTFLSDTPLYLLDEAFSAIDVQNRNYFLDMFLEMDDKMICVITHDISDAFLSSFDRVIQLENGKIVK